MFENPRRGRQARNFTTNVPKILVLKSSSEQIYSRKLPLGAPEIGDEFKTAWNAECHTSHFIVVTSRVLAKSTDIWTRHWPILTYSRSAQLRGKETLQNIWEHFIILPDLPPFGTLHSRGLYRSVGFFGIGCINRGKRRWTSLSILQW